MILLAVTVVAVVVCSLVGRWWAVFVPPLIPGGALFAASPAGSPGQDDGVGAAVLSLACFAAAALTFIGVLLRRLQRWLRANS